MSNTQEFLSQIKAGCLSLWSNYGILPSVAGAQAGLESGWGTSSLASKYKNLFGIKGQGVALPTTEFYDGKTPVGIVDEFRVYPNWNTSVLDYGGFLANYGNKPNRYDNALGLTNPRDQITAIWKAGYATDPDYVSKIMATIEANGLAAWDAEVLNGPNNATTGNQIKVIGLTADVQRANVPKIQQKTAGIYLAEKIKGAGEGLIELNSIPNGKMDIIYNSLIKDYKIPAAQIRKVSNTVLHVFGLAADTQRKWVPDMQKKYAGVYLVEEVNGNHYQTIELNNLPAGTDVEAVKKSLMKDFNIPDHQIK